MQHCFQFWTKPQQWVESPRMWLRRFWRLSVRGAKTLFWQDFCPAWPSTSAHCGLHSSSNSCLLALAKSRNLKTSDAAAGEDKEAHRGTLEAHGPEHETDQMDRRQQQMQRFSNTLPYQGQVKTQNFAVKALWACFSKLTPWHGFGLQIKYSNCFLYLQEH